MSIEDVDGRFTSTPILCLPPHCCVGKANLDARQEDAGGWAACHCDWCFLAHWASNLPSIRSKNGGEHLEQRTGDTTSRCQSAHDVMFGRLFVR